MCFEVVGLYIAAAAAPAHEERNVRSRRIESKSEVDGQEKQPIGADKI